MKWLNCSKMRLMFVGFVIIGLLSKTSVSLAEEDTWTRKADMPTARSALSASVADGKVYAIGGGPTNVPTKIVERYDPVIDSWTTRSSMQTARAFFGSATVNGRVYAIGGYGSAGVGAFLASVEEYNPVTDTWRHRANMPTKRSWLCVSALNGKIYAIGGVLNTAEATGTVEAYDPVADAWMPKADMPTQRGGAAAASVDGKIYVIGGAVGNLHNHPLSIVEAYDPVTDTWTRKADMPTARMTLAVSVMCGKIYAIGGYDFLGPIYATVEVYDPATDTWTNMPDMQFQRKALASAAVNGKIYAIGGQPVAGWNAPISVVEEYDLNPSLDFNGDGNIDTDDLLILMDNWGTDNSLCDIAPMPWGDGIVDMEDLTVFIEYWEKENFINVDEDDNGGQVTLKDGQRLVITLESNPTTGYSWELIENQNSILEQIGEAEFVPPEQTDPPIVGAGGQEIFRFKAVTAGQETLELIYRRPWETDAEPAKTFSIDVIVN